MVPYACGRAAAAGQQQGVKRKRTEWPRAADLRLDSVDDLLEDSQDEEDIQAMEEGEGGAGPLATSEDSLREELARLL